MMNEEMKENRAFLWIIALGFFMETLDSTIVNTALPAMATSLHTSPLSMHSVIIAYSMALALLIPASGWIADADKIGVKKTYMAAIAVFTLGSLCCALAPTLRMLVFARILQGVGGSMLIPIGRLALLRVFPKGQYLAAMSFVSIPALIGPLVGPMLGGFLVQIASWHWIFLINIPVGIVAILCTMKYMPSVPSFPVGKFDVTGFLMLGIAMVAISFGLDGISDQGFKQATIVVLLVFGFAALVGYIFHAGNHEEPLFPLNLFKVRTFALGLLGNVFARIGSAAMPFLIPLFLQVSLGYTALQSGFTMFPVAFAAIFARRFAPPLIERFGYRRVLLVNTLIVGFSIITFMFISAHEPAWLRVIQFMVFGAANSVQFSAMNSLTLKDLHGPGTGSGNGLFSMAQMLSMSFGVAVAGALLTSLGSLFSDKGGDVGSAFHSTFLCMGLITCFSTWIFVQLAHDHHGRMSAVEAEIPD